MKKNILFAVVVAVPFLLAKADQTDDKASYVNPMIGTEGMGHTFPGACAPFGIVQLSPDTDTIPTTSTECIKAKCMSIVLAISTPTTPLWGSVIPI